MNDGMPVAPMRKNDTLTRARAREEIYKTALLNLRRDLAWANSYLAQPWYRRIRRPW